ncbi:MAG: RidA family protein [Dehalococcoidia bacterium]|nr:RidA family protein [Dehalococcoidia bacterium]
MKKRVHDVDVLTKAGHYSHVVEAGGFLFVSGIVPVDREKNLRITDDIKAATELVLNNVKKTLESVGSSLDKVVKATVFLRDMTDFKDMNEVYLAFFPKEPPARSCVAVKEVPGNFPVEIEVIAIK